MSVGQIVGTVAGFFLGGPKGAYYGYMLGSIIDPVDGPTVYGPRLKDLSVQTSTDGASLPRIFGTLSGAGNVFWSTGLNEKKHKETAGGGSGGGATSVTYTYTSDLAISLCEGEIAGVRRIWADTKLIYDKSDAADVSTLVASNKFARGIRIYTGSETQDPDPLIQSIEGVDSTPAYRGTAYVVLEDLKLADFYNRVPNFTFEVIAHGTADLYYRVADTAAPGYAWTTRERIVSVDGVVRTVVCGSERAKLYNLSTGALRSQKTRTVAEQVAREEAAYADAYTIGVFDGERLVRTYGTPQQVYLAAPYDAENPTVYASGDSISDLWPGYQAYAIIPCVDNRHILVILTTGTYYYTPPTHGAYGNGTWMLVDVIEREVVDTGDVKASSGYFTYYFSNYPTPEGWGAMSMESDLSHIWQAYGAGGLDIRLFSISASGDLDIEVTSESAEWPDWTAQGFALPTLWADDGLCWVMSGYYSSGAYGGDFSVYSRAGGVVPVAPGLDVVVAALLKGAGLAAADYDVTALASDTVRGYAVNGPGATRAALEPLMAAHHFDLAEIDGQIVAVKRGGASVATLTPDDLGAAETPGPNLVDVTLANESELPSEISIGYLDADNDYEAATQPARRLTALHENKKTIELAMALTSAEAARIAEIALNQAWWSQRATLGFSTGFEFLRLSPADVVTLPVYGETLTARLVGMDYGAPGLMRMEAVPDIPSLYTSTVVGADPAGVGQTLGVDGPMLGLLLDSVMLRDVDTGPGLYLAASGYVPSWPGGSTYKSNDGGATWTAAVNVSADDASTIGYATTVLADADCRVWDKTNRLTLRMIDGTLASATEIAVLNGANAALLGDHGRWELLQFKTVAANVDGTYTLSDFLRGRRGTEWAASQHTNADAFILLTASTVQNIDLTSTEIGATRDYRHVTYNRALEEVIAESLTYTGERLKPLAPVMFNAAVQPSGDVTLTWTRRDRIAKAWNTITALPQSEDTEAWEIDVSVAGTVARTISVSSAAATYTSSQQIADGFPPGTSATFLIYQISAVTGRGHVTSTTATLAPDAHILADESPYTMPLVGYGTLWNGSSLLSPTPGATGYSSDSTGATWTKNLAPTYISPSQIVYNGTRYVAVVIPGWQVPYWSDTTTNPAASWTATSLSSLLDGTLNFLFDLLVWDSGASKFTIIGTLGTPHAKNFTTSDGTTWAAVEQTTDRPASAAEPIVGSKAIWTGTNHVVAGHRTMTNVNPLYDRHQSRIWRSADLLAWSQVHAGSDYSHLNSLQISGTTLIAVGYKQSSATSPWLALILRSTNDGASWTDVSPSILSAAAADLASIHRISSNWVAVGRNFTCKSTDDGLTWTVTANPAGTTFTQGGAGDGSTFIVAGGYTIIDGTVAQTQLWRTTDGAIWTQQLT